MPPLAPRGPERRASHASRASRGSRARSNALSLNQLELELDALDGLGGYALPCAKSFLGHYTLWGDAESASATPSPLPTPPGHFRPLQRSPISAFKPLCKQCVRTKACEECERAGLA